MENNLITRTTELAKTFWLSYLNEGSVAIDATVGNGNDTLFLAERCRKVYGFDIQSQAMEKTTELLGKHNLNNVELYNVSHEHIDEYVSEEADLIVFNLGYLPGGDKQITTDSNSTITAVSKSLPLLRQNGLLSIMMYWGHPQGREEREKLLEFSRNLDNKKYHCVYVSTLNQKACPPEILLITRKK